MPGATAFEAAPPPGLQISQVWADHRPLETSSSAQAATVFTEAIDRFGSRPFVYWQGVAALEMQGAIPPSLLAALRGLGYVGALTLVPVGQPLRDML